MKQVKGLFINVFKTYQSGSHRFISSKKLVFHEFGEPVKVVNVVEEELPKVMSTEVVVKMLVAPVNPADINTIQGVYPIKPTLPAVPGFEGVGEVVEVGSDVSSLAVGDHVIPDTQHLGTWRNYGKFNHDVLMKVPKDIALTEISGITSNPCTAYRMLKDYNSLSPGDVVIQNGANSACGQNVIQIARHWGLKTINIVRNRDDIDKLKSYLKSLGADYVFTEEELRNISRDASIPKPKLALNCVGGNSATNLLRTLVSKGVMVTYGGMSREPVQIPTSAFIFKDITLRGHWMTRWQKENKESAERKSMMNELTEMMRTGKLAAPAHKFVTLKNFQEALMNTMSIQGKSGVKYYIDFRQ
ncbi:enoyl-[acyl-carrier-protein] reductase, mitochondrial isoform X3 [Diaphorina citri]|uniref:Enoyl-[acyl-carrier-protein] reductase, mitochondrial n=1 Tax=Diaphorina citri TaxID=121845 RepID=A0A3Q0ITL9_DIACI|nr:enoyl-[acyl-carrier-protein] reductase, mitochondrial isoform X3 [Diaphorina citri]